MTTSEAHDRADVGLATEREAAHHRRAGLAKAVGGLLQRRTRRGRGTTKSARRGRERWYGLAMVAPLVLGQLVFHMWPVIRTAHLSFTESGVFGGSTWVGLENYGLLLSDDRFLPALGHTFVYTAIVLLGIPFALAFAALLNQPWLRARGIFRTLYFVPVVTLPAAIALLWSYLYNGDYGLINTLLGFVGLDGLSWMTDPRTALIAIGIVGIWGAFGRKLVIFMAGLQGIPRQLYEAAAIDGAGAIRQFRHITFPLISPITFFLAVLTVIGSLKLFDLVYLMVGTRSPATDATRTVVVLFYEAAFVQQARGYAAAVAVALFIVIAFFTALQFALQRRWVHYDV